MENAPPGGLPPLFAPPLFAVQLVHAPSREFHFQKNVKIGKARRKTVATSGRNWWKVAPASAWDLGLYLRSHDERECVEVAFDRG